MSMEGRARSGRVYGGEGSLWACLWSGGLSLGVSMEGRRSQSGRVCGGEGSVWVCVWRGGLGLGVSMEGRAQSGRVYGGED